MAVWLHINKQNKRTRTRTERERDKGRRYIGIKLPEDQNRARNRAYKTFLPARIGFHKTQLRLWVPTRCDVVVSLPQSVSQSVCQSVHQSGSLSGSPSFTELYNNNNVLIEQKSSPTIAEPVEQQLLREPLSSHLALLLHLHLLLLLLLLLFQFCIDNCLVVSLSSFAAALIPLCLPDWLSPFHQNWQRKAHSTCCPRATCIVYPLFVLLFGSCFCCCSCDNWLADNITEAENEPRAQKPKQKLNEMQLKIQIHFQLHVLKIDHIVTVDINELTSMQSSRWNSQGIAMQTIAQSMSIWAVLLLALFGGV